MITWKKRFAALLAALLCALGAISLASAEEPAQPSAAEQRDRLYKSILNNGYCYFKTGPNFPLYSDPACTEENFVGNVMLDTVAVATGYDSKGTGDTVTDDAVEVWVLKMGKLTQFWSPRSSIASVQAASSIEKRIAQDKLKPAQVGGHALHLGVALVKPVGGEGLAQWWAELKFDFYHNFIYMDNWTKLTDGLINTLKMTFGALLIGIGIGVVIALIRSIWETNGKKMRGPVKLIMCILDKICLVYTTVIRGTPMVVQLLILYYIVFSTSNNGVMVATLSFGINSGAYVAEIFRSGILSIDKGQMEAGRSIGLNYAQTMWYIIAPQVLKNVLPTLANEFITLLKETSIAGYVAVQDLTFAGNRIRGVTYSAFMPLIAVAIIYLILVTVLTWLVGKLERRLRQGDNR